MKYSRQRELIYQTVVRNPIHPTADAVYAIVREQEPNISLGTVYRNLNQLSQQGMLRKICIPNASDRFDARCEEHHHMICSQCGRVFDVALGPLDGLDRQIEKISEFTVTGYQILFEGVCHDCEIIH